MASIRKHPNSRYWIACYTASDGKRTNRSTKILVRGENPQKTSEQRREAQRTADLYEEVARGKLTAIQIQKVLSQTYQRGTGKMLPSFSVGEYVKRWLERKTNEISYNSLKFYTAKTKDFLAWLGPTRITQDIRGITADDIHSYRDSLATRVSATTVNHNLKTLRMVLESARREGVITDNPASVVSSLRKLRESPRRAFTVKEVEAILSVADDEWRSLVLFGLYTGQRLGDLACLTWQSIDLQRNEIRFVTKKTGRNQILRIAKPLRQHIESLKVGDDPKQPLHPRAFDTYYKQKKSGTLSRQFYELMAQAGLVEERPHTGTGNERKGKRNVSEISFHCFRHTLTSMLKSANVSSAIVEELVGHESSAINQLYTHIDGAALQNAVDLMPDVTKGVKPSKKKKATKKTS